MAPHLVSVFLRELLAPLEGYFEDPDLGRRKLHGCPAGTGCKWIKTPIYKVVVSRVIRL